MANADEMHATLAVIKENPQLWDQDVFYRATERGTVACFYGWTLLRRGCTDIDAMSVEEIHRTVTSILEIGESEGDALAYHFTNSIEDLELRVKEIIAGEWVEQRDFDEVE